MRMLRLVALLTLPASLFPLAAFAQQKHPITFDAFSGLPVVSDPQLTPDGKWVAYTVTTPSLKDNRGFGRIWLAEVATGRTRQLTQGPGLDFSPRWSPDGQTLAFISTRQGGPQIWVLGMTGGEARKVTALDDGVGELYWKPDGRGFLAVVDVKWPAEQEIDRRNGEYPTEARLWTELMWRHWGEFRAGHRRHVFAVALATGKGTDRPTVDHDVPTIATGGDGDVAVSPGGREIAGAMHGDDAVATNTNVDVYELPWDGRGTGDESKWKNVTAANKGADNTPR